MSHICLLPPLKWSKEPLPKELIPRQPCSDSERASGYKFYDSDPDEYAEALAAYKSRMILVANPVEAEILLLPDHVAFEEEIYPIDCEAVIKWQLREKYHPELGWSNCQDQTGNKGESNVFEYRQVVTLSPKRDEQKPDYPGQEEDNLWDNFLEKCLNHYINDNSNYSDFLKAVRKEYKLSKISPVVEQDKGQEPKFETLEAPAFAIWYSGMSKEKVTRAYARWKKENPTKKQEEPASQEEVFSEIEKDYREWVDAMTYSGNYHVQYALWLRDNPKYKVTRKS